MRLGFDHPTGGPKWTHMTRCRVTRLFTNMPDGLGGAIFIVSPLTR